MPKMPSVNFNIWTIVVYAPSHTLSRRRQNSKLVYFKAKA